MNTESSSDISIDAETGSSSSAAPTGSLYEIPIGPGATSPPASDTTTSSFSPRDDDSTTGAVPSVSTGAISRTSSSTSTISTGNSKKKSVKEYRREMKERYESDSKGDSVMGQEYQQGINCGQMVRKDTGIVHHSKMLEHACTWDDDYPEKPERYSCIMRRFEELKLLERCKRLQHVDVTSEDILKVHDFQHLASLRRICLNFDGTLAETEASKYDAIYFNKDTYDCAKMAVNLTVTLAIAIANGEVQNGMAIVRPPGHHAQNMEYNGYCFFNNVAIAAKYLIDKFSMKKIMIIDFDVHHGQGTQNAFYEDDRVLYFSIHRYEHAKFWPNLRQGCFDYVGEGKGLGYNINVPLNAIELGDADYMAIVTHILLPVAYEFQPEMIIFSAGYDACIGCPEGEMNVTPGFYGHLIKLLSGLAEGKLEVVLEGGYFLPSLAEGAAMTLRALLDDAPAFLEPLGVPHPAVASTINDLKFMLHDTWKCFKIFDTFENPSPPVPVERRADDNLHTVIVRYEGTLPRPPFKTRNCYPVQDPIQVTEFTEIIDSLKIGYGMPLENKVCYTYHPGMLQHTSDTAVENHRRLEVVYQRFLDLGLDKRCQLIKSHPLEDGIVSKVVHKQMYLNKIFNDEFPSSEKSNDLYWCKNGKSKNSITKAVSSILALVDAVMSAKYSAGVALIRPPGHHAGKSSASGFCFLNNAAIAAQHILDNYAVTRVLILDFDLHHGNGTQEIFYETGEVLYISIHKYESGSFFPYSNKGDSKHTGAGDGEGFNVNIPFNKEKMGDMEYISAFHRIVLPIAYSYAPEFIIVSAGFDAGINDLLGNYRVSPETFGHFIQLLRPLAGGRIILAMEGGYNLTTLEHSMNFCVKALLGDPLPKLNNVGLIRGSAYRTLQEVIIVQKRHWPVLATDKLLPDRISELYVKTATTDFRICDPKQKLTCARIRELMVHLDLED